MAKGDRRNIFSRAIENVAAALDWFFTQESYRRIVGRARDLLLALWICRVPAFSVALGLLVFWIAPQSRDIFLEIAGHLGTKEGSWVKDLDTDNLLRSAWFAFQFCVALLLLWAIPLHGAARWSLDNLANPPKTLLGRKTEHLTRPRPRLDPRTVKYVPRMLGLLCFLAILLGLGYAAEGRFDARVQTAAYAATQVKILTAAVVIAAIIYALYVSYRFELFQRTLGRLRPTRISIRRTAAGSTVRGPGVSILRFIGVAAAVLVTVLLAWYVLVPQDKAEHLITWESRAVIIPLVLGASVPLFSFITWISYPARLPVVTILIASVIFYKAFLHEGHDIRRLDEALPAAGVELSIAIEQWRAANGCQAPADVSTCPAPIIVAAAGAASRAGFMTGSALGYFMDLTCSPGDKQAFLAKRPDASNFLGCPPDKMPLFASRTFAISAVSGGAVAAVVFSALLREYASLPVTERNEAGVPCAGYSRLWLRPGPPRGWRDCMQMILSQDFLSPPIIALAFRDQWPILDAILSPYDRAAALEDAWIEAFDKFSPHAAKQTGGRRGLADAFDHFAPNPSDGWRPLLMLNGTSVANGRRIVTSHLALNAEFKGKDGHSEVRPIVNDAYDIREMLTAGGKPAAAFSLATAASNSARFPLISPQGVLRDTRGDTIDRVVDGGFFENFGVTTANDLARALITHQLRPVILLITNDPTSVERVRQLDDLDRVAPQLPDAREAPPLAWLIAPLEALYATRTSRGELAILRTGQEAHGSERDVVHVPIANVTVYGEPVSKNSGNDLQYKEVSWSWWLSKPVQEYLDNQFFLKSYAGGLENRPDGGGPWDGEQVLMLNRVCEWLADPKDPTKALVDQCKTGIRAFLQQR